MASNTVNKVTVNNTTYPIEDTTARAYFADIPDMQTDITNLQTTTTSLGNNKVAKAGDTMTGDLIMSSGNGVKLTPSSGYSRVDASNNQIILRAYDSSDDYRGLRLYAPTGQSNDDQGLQYYTASNAYMVDITKYMAFSGTSLTAISRVEYANNTAISSLSLTWPAGHRGMIFGVNFTSGSSFSGITHYNSSGTAFTPKYPSTLQVKASQRYNLVCWYDGQYYWCSIAIAAV